MTAFPWWGYVLAGIAVAAALGAVGWLVVRRIDKRIPGPTNFAEGLRALDNALAAASGPFYGVMAIALIAILMWGGWSKSEEHTIVLILGFSLGGYIVLQGAVTVGLLVGGPVGRFDASVDKTGAHISASQDPDATPAAIVRSAAAGAAEGAVNAAVPPPVAPQAEE